MRDNGPPPYSDPATYLPMVNGEHLWNDWSHVYGDQGRREPPDNHFVPEYSLIDLRTDVPRLEVPVYLVQGRYEARGRAVLAEQWFDLLDAPLKQLITFERSGHRPFVQEPEQLHALLTGTVLRDTAPDRVLVWSAGPAEQPDELIALFARYNPAVWPAQLVAYALVLLGLWRVVRRPGLATDRFVAGLIAGLWLWLGVVFHGRYGAQLAPGLEAVYGTLFVLQAGLLARAGWLGRLVLTRGSGFAGRLGWVTLAYALVAYPLLGAALGHGYPEAPLLGVAPCPSVIATFGLLLLVRPPLPRHLLAVPLLWAVLAPLAAVGRGLLEDVGLLVLGVLATVVLLVRDRYVQQVTVPMVPAQREPDSASLVTRPITENGTLR